MSKEGRIEDYEMNGGDRMRKYSLMDAHILANTLKGEEPEIEDVKTGELVSRGISEMSRQEHPVNDDTPFEEEEKVEPVDEEVFIEELSSYLDTLAGGINLDSPLKAEAGAISSDDHLAKKDDGDYNFVKGTPFKPQESLEPEEKVITCTPPDGLASWEAKSQIKDICLCLVNMGYIENYSLQEFRSAGIIRLFFDPARHNEGARQMAYDCIMNGVAAMPKTN